MIKIKFEVQKHLKNTFVNLYLDSVKIYIKNQILKSPQSMIRIFYYKSLV
jgi:hypothetical protein